MIKKKILILGSNSQLSRCLFNNKNTNFKYYFLNKKQLDITNFNQTQKIINKIKPIVIINCIAFTNVDDAEDNKILVNRVNFIGVKNIIKSIHKLKILLVHFSTDYVYDGKKKYSYVETDTPKPLSIYGVTKLKGDSLIINNYNFYLIFRISWLYSEYGNNFLLSFVKSLRNKSTLNVVNNNLGRPTNANDLAKFVFFAIEKTLINPNLSGIYNFSDNGKYISWFRLVQFIYSQMKIKGIKVPKLNKISQKLYKSKAPRPINSRLNLKKIYYKFNFKPNNWKKNISKEINKILIK